MNKNERELLLATARILRSILPEIKLPYWEDDVRELTKVLAPFSGTDAEPTNESDGARKVLFNGIGIGDEVEVLHSRFGAWLRGVMTDCTQDGDVTVRVDTDGPNPLVVHTKWRFVRRWER